ncbi:MAG: hypothetical protein U5L45_22415 [Saprospiraceae bacterium]|nr:hypothetical protein [Saprospiraceae bacterium]
MSKNILQLSRREANVTLVKNNQYIKRILRGLRRGRFYLSTALSVLPETRW